MKRVIRAVKSRWKDLSSLKRLAVLFILLALPAIAALALHFSHADRARPFDKARIARPPEIAPVVLLRVSPDDARAINAAVPFVKAPLARAPAFHFVRTRDDYDRARDCLASAAWYEAGDDKVGEQSVVQVVLNRVVHPAFPKTVCDVVFQGAERATGCQFTFACDGALRRRQPSTVAWMRAQAIADSALGGFVDPKVGLATHYHTDWVVPSWSASLDKIAQVGTHLFFRFRGYWGERAALRRPSGAPEPKVAMLASLSAAHGKAQEAAFVMPKPTDADILALVDRLQKQGPTRQSLAPAAPQTNANGLPDLKGNRMAVSDPAKGHFGLTLDLNRAPGSYALVARALCGTRSRCKVLGWRRETAPAHIRDFDAKQGKALFSFRSDGKGNEQALWDCRELPRPASQCMAGTVQPTPQEVAEPK